MSENENEEMQEDIDPVEDDEDYTPPTVNRHMRTRRSEATAAAAAAAAATATATTTTIPETITTTRKILNLRAKCPYGCNKVLAQRTIDYHRTNGCRMGQEEPFADSNRKKNYCCGVCWAEFVTRVAFLTHLSEEHEVQAAVHNLEFDDKAQFMRFVRWLEAEGGAHFRHKSGAKKRASGKGIFMACNRSGYVGRHVTDPIKNKTGNFRTGYTCTGFIHGTEHPDGKITIEFCGDHYGHDARMRLPNVVKQLVAQKQMDGESFVDITNYLRRQFAPFAHECIYAQRVCLVDLDELRTLLVTTTRKWEQAGIPVECEIWEEELLEKAGIRRDGVPKVRKPDDKPTDQLAVERKWPRPTVFIPKMKVNGNFVEIPELSKATAEARRDVALHCQKAITEGDVPPAKNLGRFRTARKDPTREQSKIINVEDDDSEPENADDAETQEAEAKARRAPAIVLRGARSKKDSTKLISRQQCINGMLEELDALGNMIRDESSTASGAFLVAFMTRIRQLKMSYSQGITPVSQPMSEQQSRMLANGIHINSANRPAEVTERPTSPEKQNDTEEGIARIGEDFNLDEIAKEVASKCTSKKVIPSFWT